MKLSSEQWKNGISDSHYSGVANLRNVRIDDTGVLRVINKPTLKKAQVGIIDLKKNYYEGSNAYYGVIKSGISGSGNGGIYESTTDTLKSANSKLSGGISYRDYFFPFPSSPNVDAGYWVDSNGDGSYETYEGGFETLITKGQTRDQLIEKFAEKDWGRQIAIVNNDRFVIHESSSTGTESISVKDMTGATIATVNISTYETKIRDVVNISETHFAVITTDAIYSYDLAGNLIHTLAQDFADDKQIRAIRSTNRGSDNIVVLTHLRDTDDQADSVQFFSYEFVSNVMTLDNSENVFNGDDGEKLSTSPYITNLNEDIAIIIQDIYTTGEFYNIKIYEATGWTNSYTSTSYPYTYYAPIVSIDNNLILLRDNPIIYEWNDADNELNEINNSLIAPNNVESVKAFGSILGIVQDVTYNKYSVYDYTSSVIEFTPSIIIRDEVYWANGNSVAALRENGEQDSFDPEDSGTYTLELDALDLPFGTQITALADIGLFMAIGTQSGKIYFWDLNNTYYELPVNIGEPIASMKSKNNLLYVVSQTAGNVYVANLTSYEKLRNLSSLTKSRFDVIAGGMDFFDDGSFMGAKVYSDDTYTGVWIYKNKAWTLLGTDEEVISISKATPNIVVYATTSGIYELDIAGEPRALWDNDDAYIISPMMVGGSVANKKVDTHYSIYFDNYFGENEYVKIYARTTTAGEWKLLDTKTSADMGEELGLFAVRGQLGVPKSEQIQYKVVLNTTAGMVLFETI